MNNITSSPSDWQAEFKAVWDRGIVAWKSGRKSPSSMFNAQDVAFLSGIGCSAQELFDFVDDHLRYGDFGFETAAAVAAIRRKYLIEVMKGQKSTRIARMQELPAKSASVDGIEWLPRLIVKARLKLRGEMPDELMYGCAGDRPFLRRMKMSLEQFLQLTWDSGDDDRKIINTVKKCAGLE